MCRLGVDGEEDIVVRECQALYVMLLVYMGCEDLCRVGYWDGGHVNAEDAVLLRLLLPCALLQEALRIEGEVARRIYALLYENSGLYGRFRQMVCRVLCCGTAEWCHQ